MTKFILSLALLIPMAAFADFTKMKWDVVENKNGIKVFQARESHAKSGIVPLRVQTVLNFSIARILSVIGKSERKDEWVPYMKVARQVSQPSQYEKVEYARYSSPWPFDDRVFVVHSKGSWDPVKKEILIMMKSINHPSAPPEKDTVRGHTYMGRVILTYVEKDKTRMDMTFVTDFKGNIPIWIINMVQKKWPRKLMKRLSKQLSKADIVIPKIYSEIEKVTQ